MMNIFIMILVALFMTGYYLMDSPSQSVQKHNTQYAITQADLRTIAQCATAMHNAQINGFEFNDICVEQNNIRSEFVCLDNKLKITKCDAGRNRKPAYSYIVTATGTLDEKNHNNMMQVLETHFADAGTFGMFMDNAVVAGGTSTKRNVPAAIVDEMKLENNQLVYFTQYEIPDAGEQVTVTIPADVVCPAGTAKTYKFGRWQCVAYNPKTNCGGDMVWDSDLYECVPDESRKPLCGTNQTAILVDSVWECVEPFPDKQCPTNMVARLNYNTLEWECVIDPTTDKTIKKCNNVIRGAVSGTPGATLRIPQSPCTDCERMVVDPETCKATCLPDPAKIDDAKCYPGATAECSGPTRAFFFGFPNAEYIKNVTAVSGLDVPLDGTRAQNRKFNCMDCAASEQVIDTEKSRPPYVVVCK
ncbi:MAG: hypothetical protein IKW57_04540 [Alphaproteobacteria bacterium]|nr:hypothetical protein [Alphaproteobacteria bacterium]